MSFLFAVKCHTKQWRTRYSYCLVWMKSCVVGMRPIAVFVEEGVYVHSSDCHLLWLSFFLSPLSLALFLTAISNFPWWKWPRPHPPLVLCHLLFRQHCTVLADEQSRLGELLPCFLSGLSNFCDVPSLENLETPTNTYSKVIYASTVNFAVHFFLKAFYFFVKVSKCAFLLKQILSEWYRSCKLGTYCSSVMGVVMEGTSV